MNQMLKTPEVSRRSMLAGLGGMTFCLALGTDGVSLLSEAQAATMANAAPGGYWNGGGIT